MTIGIVKHSVGGEAAIQKSNQVVNITANKSMDNLPTEIDLEKKLVLGQGTLPKVINLTNTKIFAKNGVNDVFVMKYVKGKITRPKTGIVLTDEVCKPDTYGYFHCWNNIKLSNGTTIRGTSIHDMQGGVPCLQPDTNVVVTPYSKDYFLLERNVNRD